MVRYWQKIEERHKAGLTAKEEEIVRRLLTLRHNLKPWTRFRSEINKWSGRFHSKRKLTKFIKKEMKCSFKNGLTRSDISHDPKLKYVQWIFGWRALGWLQNGDFVINVDESAFSKSFNYHCSWLPRGRSSPIINQNCRESETMIFALWYNGEWITCIYNCTTRAERFFKFLLLLKYYWDLVLFKPFDDVKLTFDNAAIHNARITQVVIQYLVWTVYFLPQ